MENVRESNVRELLLDAIDVKLLEISAVFLLTLWKRMMGLVVLSEMLFDVKKHLFLNISRYRNLGLLLRR